MGIDLGDQYSRFCVLNADGEIAEQGRLGSTREAFLRRFRGRAATRIILETGTHSPWVDELLRSLGHEVFVANARKTRLISSTEYLDGDSLEVKIRSWSVDGGDPDLLARMDVPKESMGTFFGLDPTESLLAWVEGSKVNLQQLGSSISDSAPITSLEHEQALHGGFR